MSADQNLNLSDYLQIAVSAPVGDGILTYKKNPSLDVHAGDLVEVPLGRRKAKGVVVENLLNTEQLKEVISKFETKEIASKVADSFSLSAKELELYTWMAKYYHYNLGMLVWDCLPKILKRPREADIEFGKNLKFEHQLNEDQNHIFTNISKKLSSGFDRYYIHGVTGSGKTLIYLNLMKKVLSQGKSVLFLLPEINLTPQFIETFKSYLDCPILSYHSGVTDSHKNEVWKYLKTHTDKPVLIMGVRSSVFLPSENIGLIIVDEEHDQSFKQSDRCPYNGRDVAIKKAQIFNCPIVMGSATPALENYYTFKNLKPENYFTLKNRASGGFPDIKLIDARKESGKSKSMDELLIWPFEQQALDLMRESFSKNEQVLVFVNRLGFANFVQCRNCGHKFEDPNTGVPLRYFKNKKMLSSGHSDYQIPLPEICPSCGNMNLLQMGFGTEKLQEVLQKVFPDKVIERFDRDEITTLEKLEDSLEKFHQGEIDVFVGTQMLSKGHNFKKVNLVLILGIDSMLNFPDFRAMERTYQMLVQILGRAGRYSADAKVVIQTLLPENQLFKFVIDHDFNGYYDFELKPRKIGNFPPFSKMCSIHISSKNRDQMVAKLAHEVDQMDRFCKARGLEVEIMGPTPGMIERRANMFTWSILLTSSDVNHLHTLINYFKNANSLDNHYSVKIDVDPYQIL